MGKVEKDLESIVLISDKDTSKIEDFLKEFNYQKFDFDENFIFKENPRTVVYVGDDDLDSDENLFFLLNMWEETNFIILSKLNNGKVKRPSENFYNDKRLLFLDTQSVLNDEGTILKEELTKAIQVYAFPELNNTRFHIRPYETSCYFLIGPSGVGKTSIINRLSEELDNINENPIIVTTNIKKKPTIVTTRKKRFEELDKCKKFLTQEEFKKLEAENKFLFVWEINNYNYAFPEEILSYIKEGYDLIFDSLDLKTIKNLENKLIKKNFDIKFVPIFLTSEIEELERRYITRDEFGKNEEQDLKKIQERLIEIGKQVKTSNLEFKKLLTEKKYPYLIHNNSDLDRSINIVKNIITYSRRRKSYESFVDSIFQDIFDCDFGNSEFVNNIVFDEPNKNSIVEYYINQEIISKSQKDTLFGIIDKISKIKVYRIERNKSNVTMVLKKESLTEDNYNFLKSVNLSDGEIVRDLLQGATKYFPTFFPLKLQRVSSSTIGNFYVENEEAFFVDLLGWSISDNIPDVDCKKIKSVGITLYGGKIENYKIIPSTRKLP